MNLPAFALWYQRNKNHLVVDKRPAIELHVNLWRRIGRRPWWSLRRRSEIEINYLDLGIQIKEHRDLDALNLYVPFPRESCEIKDLGHLLREKNIASAVFNEVLEVENSKEDYPNTFSIRKNGDHFLSVHIIDVNKDIIESDNLSQPLSHGFIMQLSSQFCAKLQAPGEHYVRFRFKLLQESAKVFSEDVSNEDGFILSSITNSEITEIRINEVRSIPGDIQRHAKQYEWLAPEISTIHYFLVRDISFDLVASHASLRKIRRMEPEWDNYLGDEFPDGSARRMLIYHWRKDGDGGDVGDFVTLAKFRRSKGNLLVYVFLVVALGGIGSGIHATLSWGLNQLAGQGATTSGGWWDAIQQRIACVGEVAIRSWWDLLTLRVQCLTGSPQMISPSNPFLPRNGSEVLLATFLLVVVVLLVGALAFRSKK